MNIYITSILDRSMCFLGAALMIALIVPAVVLSQLPLPGVAIENSLAYQKFALSQNYPNPFNPSTKIRYSIENTMQVSLKVFNLLGHEIATLVNGRQEAGSYTVQFNTNDSKFSLASGMYFYRLETGSFVSVRKLVVLR